jgi:serine/threonine protein kinase
MGVVYQATDITLRRDVAIKTLTRLSEDAAERLMVEARTMAALSHPQIAVLYGAELWRGTPMLVMECLGGGTLAARLRRGPLATAEALELVKLLALALEHVHRSGLYHGDIKPSNIGFTLDGSPKFLDFGLARAIGGDLMSKADRADGSPGRRPIAGTLAYLSPEVREGDPPGPALDVWALAVVLCECLTGRHPFLTARTSAEIADGVNVAVVRIDSSAGKELGALIRRTLSVQTNRSLQTAADLANSLASLASPAQSKPVTG